MRATVIVLGDVGRSPRMQYHALALADNQVDVDLIGFAGTPPWETVRKNPRISCHLLVSPALPFDLPRVVFIIVSPARAIWNGLRALALLLFVVPKPDVILVQTPPAVPTLPIALMGAWMRSARLVVDWHNLGYTMLALRLGERHALVALARWCERAAGRRAAAHLCVSKAMHDRLRDQWDIDAAVCYDRPAERAAIPVASARGTARRRLGELIGTPIHDDTAIVVSPTSWTPDEDFELLFEALSLCELEMTRRAAEGRHDSDVLIVITGRGPMRAAGEQRIAKLAPARVRLRTAWLERDDYTALLAAADLGLCLHRSSSGLDLPMKIADMFGAGLPVVALDYGPVLREILRDDENGRLISSSEGLARALCDLTDASPASAATRARLRAGAAAAGSVRWAAEWNATARAVILGNRSGHA